MKAWLKRHNLLLLWGVVPIIAIFEIIAQGRVQLDVPAAADWEAAARRVAAEKGDHDLVVIAPRWATQGRTPLRGLISERDFGRFDTRSYDRLFEVSVNGARSPETERLTPEETHRFGNLVLRRYRLPTRHRVVYDFLDHVGEAAFSKGPLTKGLVIDHAFLPRRVLKVPLKPRRSRLVFNEVPLDGVLYGYGVIGVKDYRASDYDEGGPVEVTIFLNNKKLGTIAPANFESPRHFEFPLPGAGTGTVRFDIRADSAVNRLLGLMAEVRKKGRSRS